MDILNEITKEIAVIKSKTEEPKQIMLLCNTLLTYVNEKSITSTTLSEIRRGMLDIIDNHQKKVLNVEANHKEKERKGVSLNVVWVADAKLQPKLPIDWGEKINEALKYCLLKEEDEKVFKTIKPIKPCIELYGRDIKRLKPGYWLNENIIDIFLNILKQRPIVSQSGMNILGTQFYQSLHGKGYKYVTNYLGKGAEITNFHYIVFPCNPGNHWILICIAVKKMKVMIYDSLKYTDLQKVEEEEYRKINAESFNDKDWQFIKPNVPKQNNGYDCGMFTCMYAENISRKQSKFSFSQASIPFLRHLLAYDLISGGTLLLDEDESYKNPTTIEEIIEIS